MAKYFYLYRHAHTTSAERGQQDHARELSPRGLGECVQVGRHMKEAGHIPAAILSSTATRTRSTIAQTLEAAGTAIPVEWMDALYLASPGEILRAVNQIAGNPASLMVVGHNPGLHSLAFSLAATHPDDTEMMRQLAQDYPPASLAVFELNLENWTDFSLKTDAKLIALVTPEKLPPLA